jgi:2-iminobutanoate/2-iminopropanoate deaminase
MPSREIEVIAPPGAIRPTGPWNPGVRAGDFVFVAGMRGIDPATGRLVDGDEARVRQAFLNMQTIAQAAGCRLGDAVRLVVYVTDMNLHRPIVNRIQEEFWADARYPPRTIVEVNGLNQDDIVEVEGTFFCPEKRPPT